jgi:hypothetical protein
LAVSWAKPASASCRSARGYSSSLRRSRVAV